MTAQPCLEPGTEPCPYSAVFDTERCLPHALPVRGVTVSSGPPQLAGTASVVPVAESARIGAIATELEAHGGRDEQFVAAELRAAAELDTRGWLGRAWQWVVS